MKMKTVRQLGSRSRFFGLAAVGLTLGLAARTAPAQEVCAGDCDGGGSVTVDEIIVLVNIALGSAQPSACLNGIPAGRDVDITLIVQAVGDALTQCPACGNGVVDSGETCDDGGTCIGGTNAGTPCTAEPDCTGNGICTGGTKDYFACADDSACPGGKCVHCKTFGGDGCAANCTAETDVTMPLVPGDTAGACIKPGTSGAVIHSVSFTIPLPLNGSQVVTIGAKGGDGHVPAIVKANSIQFPPIKVLSLGCACLRGVAAKTCGGTLYDIDGVMLSTDCTPRFVPGTCSGSLVKTCTKDGDCSSVTLANGETVESCVTGVCADCRGDGDCPDGQTCTMHACDGKNPCAFLHGDGNAASGVVGCGANGYSPVDVLFDQDAGGSSGTKPPVMTLSGSGPIGSAVLLSSNAIGNVTGGCSGSDLARYGPDGELCTDDDPQAVHGTSSSQFNVTGTATGKIENANGITGDDLGASETCTGPGVAKECGKEIPKPCCTGVKTGQCGYSVTGNPLSCDNLLGPSHSVSGASLVGAFVSLDVPPLYDIIVTSDLVSQ